MKNFIKRIIKKNIPVKIRIMIKEYILGNMYETISYSQEGEDLILARYFTNKKEGFWVDVGAHHPKRFSNTYYFYKLGWRGINVDAKPGSMALFRKLRPRDINLEIAVSDKKETLVYYMFDEPALNGFSLELSQSYKKKNKLISEKKIELQTLEEVLDKYLPSNQSIDFLTIDVEGFDYKVLLSNNWDKYKPDVILIEISCEFENLYSHEIYKLLNKKGYKCFAKTYNTVFFKII